MVKKRAKINAEAHVIEAKAKAEAFKIEQEMENMMDHQRNTQLLTELKEETADKYLQLQQIKSFESVEKSLILPSDSKIFVPFNKELLQ